jgi:hypothetical protein
MVWKPSPRTPLTAVAVQHLANEVQEANGCPGVFNLIVGGPEDVGERLAHDPRFPLISATQRSPDMPAESQPGCASASSVHAIGSSLTCASASMTAGKPDVTVR